MGLAYNLNVEPLQSITDWAEVMNQGDSNLWLGSSIDGDRRGRSSSVPAGDIRIPEVSDSDYDEFDIIIRNTTYVQDHYIVVGSYRAFFSSLNGGAGAWAWDGFVTIIRAHNLGFKSAMWFEQTYPGSFPPTTSDKYWLNPGFVEGFVINQPFDELNEYWTYLCRMPYECDPGLTGIGSDSTPGVYAVDSAKRFIQGAQIIKIVVGGHSRINTAVEGGLTGQDYSAWFSNLSFNIISPTITYSLSEPADCTRRYTLEFMSGESGTISINGSTNIGTGLPSTNLAPQKKQNISTQCKSSNTVAGGITTVPITGLNNNYYPTRCHDVTCINIAPVPYDVDINFAVMTGEVAYGDGAGSVSITTPFFSGWDFDDESTANTGIMTFALGNLNWMLDASVPAYNLNGAYGTAITPSFSDLKAGNQDPVQLQVMIAVDRVTHGATTNGEIYAANFSTVFDSLGIPGPNSQGLGIWPFGVKGGGIETAAGITLPDKWYAKALQQKTFTQQEEETAKALFNIEFQEEMAVPADPPNEVDLRAIPDKNLERRLATDPTLQGQSPQPVNYYAGIETPNVIQYGATNEPTFTGQPSNIAYGFLGYRSVNGPQVIMYDFGTVTMEGVYNAGTGKYVVSTVFGPDIFNFGTTMNAAIEVNRNSTTRIPVSGGWDADRDQWVYTYADSTGATVQSCNSAFDRQPATQIAYLDQTDQFPELDSDTKSAYYTPRNMTPFLDGLCFFGGAVDTTQLGQRAIQSIELTYTKYGTPTTVRGFQSFEIQGSTGRTARVWVDYLLYDNIDSLVAVVVQELGLRVTVENVEWYKRKILNDDILNMSSEEIEGWIDAQQAEYRKMLIDKERQGRLRRRRRQQSAIANGLEEILQGEFVVSNHDFIEDDFIERNLKNMSAFPDQDSQLKRQISSDAQWLEDETLYGSSVPRKETPLERRKKENEDPETEESDES
jgi:hypothetical protein